MLQILKEKFGVQCILGLTATATMVTAFSVAQHIGIHDYQDATIRGSPVPPNLMLSVSRDEDKDEVSSCRFIDNSARFKLGPSQTRPTSKLILFMFY